MHVFRVRILHRYARHLLAARPLRSAVFKNTRRQPHLIRSHKTSQLQSWGICRRRETISPCICLHDRPFGLGTCNRVNRGFRKLTTVPGVCSINTTTLRPSLGAQALCLHTMSAYGSTSVHKVTSKPHFISVAFYHGTRRIPVF